ncbi:unnamed protein product, partial [Polarella glacialis]
MQGYYVSGGDSSAGDAIDGDPINGRLAGDLDGHYWGSLSTQSLAAAAGRKFVDVPRSSPAPPRPMQRRAEPPQPLSPRGSRGLAWGTARGSTSVPGSPAQALTASVSTPTSGIGARSGDQAGGPSLVTKDSYFGSTAPT